MSANLPKGFFPGGSDGKESTCECRNAGRIHGLGRTPGEGNGKPLKNSCVGNPMDRKAGWVIVHGVAKESDVTWRLNAMNLSKPCKSVSISGSRHTNLPQSSVMCLLHVESTSTILRHTFLALPPPSGQWAGALDLGWMRPTSTSVLAFPCCIQAEKNLASPPMLLLCDFISRHSPHPGHLLLPI